MQLTSFQCDDNLQLQSHSVFLYPYPEFVKPSPEISKPLSWLKYLFAFLFCLLMIGFVAFLVLFILAISGGFGTIKGRMMPIELVSNATNHKIFSIINLFKPKFKFLEIF